MAGQGTSENTTTKGKAGLATLATPVRAPGLVPQNSLFRQSGEAKKGRPSLFQRGGGWSGAFSGAISHALYNRRLLVALPFALIFGVLAYRGARFEPAPIALILVLILLLAGAFWLRRSVRGFPAAIFLLAFWAGFSLLSLHGALFGTSMVRGVFFGEYSARVDAIHSNDGARARLIISQITPLDGRNAPPIRRARILVPAEQAPKVGEIISASMRLYRVPGPVVPGGYDSQFQSYFDGIGAFGSTTGALQVIKPINGNSLLRFITDIRNAIGKRIDAGLSLPVSGIARALIIGDQGQVDETIRDQLAASGLAHVLAISGLHLSLVAGGVFAAIRMALAASFRLGQYINVKKLAALGGMAAALTYLALSGAGVSAVRATLMLLLVFGAVLAGRRALTMRNVAFAAIFVILVDPSSIFRPGFQLSFAAVTALVGAYEGYRHKAHREQSWIKKLGSALSGIALTSLIAGAATALFAAYHFQQIAPLGVLGNMIAIPLVGFVVLPAALVAVMMMPLGFEGIFLTIMGWGIEQIIGVARSISSWGEGSFSAPLLGPAALFIALVALAWFAFFPGKLRLAGLVGAIPLLMAFGTLPRPDVMIADTTQAVAVRTNGNFELMAGKQNSFAVNAWSETFMEPIAKPNGSQPCDISACIAQGDDFTLSLVKTRDAFEEDCRRVQLIIARIPAPRSCRVQTQVIDSKDLQEKGVHWAFWTGEKFWIRPAITDINRPWRPVYNLN